VQALSFLVEHGLQFLDLLKLCSLVRTKELGFVSCARELNMRWRGVPPLMAALASESDAIAPSMWKHS
jgi:hypothetical protein